MSFSFIHGNQCCGGAFQPHFQGKNTKSLIRIQGKEKRDLIKIMYIVRAYFSSTSAGMAYFCFDLSRVFFQGATTPPTPQKSGMNLITGFVVCDRLWMRQYDGYIPFCFDLDKVFLQDTTMPPLHPFFLIVIIFFELSLLWEGGIMLLLRLSQTISSGFHHATPTPKTKFGIVIIVGKGNYASASTQPRYFFRVPPCHPYTKKFRNCHYFGKGHYASASAQPEYFLRVPPCHHYIPFFELSIRTT